MKTEVKEYVKNLKWVTLREFKFAMDTTGLQDTKLFSVVYTLEGIAVLSKKEKKKFYKTIVGLLIENPLLFHIYMGNLREYSMAVMPKKQREKLLKEWN